MPEPSLDPPDADVKQRRRVPLSLLLVAVTAPGMLVISGSAGPAGAAPDGGQAVAVPAGAGPATATPGDLNGVPMAAIERMRREAPLVGAAERITAAAGNGKASGFTGVALTADGSRVRVYWKGQPPAGVRTVIDREARKVPVAVEPARFSRQELTAAASQVLRGIEPLGESVTVSFPVSGTGLTVSAEDPAAAKALLPSTPVPLTVEKAATPAKVKKSATSAKKATAAKAAAAKALAVNQPPSPSRQDDTRPAWGGAHWINSNATGGNGGAQARNAYGIVADYDDKWHCTSGLPMLDRRTNTELMLMPASCGRPKQLFVDPTGAAVNDSIASCDCWLNDDYGLMLTRPVSGAEPFVYTGGTWSEIGWSIENLVTTALTPGQHVCLSGAHTGVACDAQVSVNGEVMNAFTPGSQGTSHMVYYTTRILPSSDPRPYTLMDGSSCGVLANPPRGEEDFCFDPYMAAGDVGAPVFTVDGGQATGVTLRGIVVRQETGGEADQNQNFVDAQSMGNVFEAFRGVFGSDLTILNKANDIR
jgi:hypothetical protein